MCAHLLVWSALNMILDRAEVQELGSGPQYLLRTIPQSLTSVLDCTHGG
jgi:hypothetical protein